MLATAVTVLVASAASAAPPRKNGTDLAGSISGPSQARAGETFSYTGTVRNDGSREAQDVALAFTVNGRDLSRMSVDPGCVVGTSSTQTIEVRCPVGTLAPGVTASRAVAVAERSAGEVTGAVQASASVPDPNTGNNSATMATQVAAAPAEPPPDPDYASPTAACGGAVLLNESQSCTFIHDGGDVVVQGVALPTEVKQVCEGIVCDYDLVGQVEVTVSTLDGAYLGGCQGSARRPSFPTQINPSCVERVPLTLPIGSVLVCQGEGSGGHFSCGRAVA